MCSEKDSEKPTWRLELNLRRTKGEYGILHSFARANFSPPFAEKNRALSFSQEIGSPRRIL
ncbi:hypothetical protein DLM78_15270 [Leptospira stimsonii]|uniref:Uncharacterized protein n=1 Tax=Leptospira stimsonii TaxID=2202203 RepID=A0A8B3CMC9_9LEPT|nr:hypothetical protein DLM78_15270 [Leptospira stimsonii]